jgi:hypothetical protein
MGANAVPRKGSPYNIRKTSFMLVRLLPGSVLPFRIQNRLSPSWLAGSKRRKEKTRHSTVLAGDAIHLRVAT